MQSAEKYKCFLNDFFIDKIKKKCCKIDIASLFTPKKERYKYKLMTL